MIITCTKLTAPPDTCLNCLADLMPKVTILEEAIQKF